MALPITTPIASQVAMTSAKAAVADMYGHLPVPRRGHPLHKG
jgi:hypothetical protein